jgi:hypothetical protein
VPPRFDVYASLTLDQETNDNLQKLADQETEGNKSRMIRLLVRRAVAEQTRETLSQAAAG